METRMTPEQSKRFDDLKGPWCTGRLLIELYGIDLQNDGRLLGAFRTWSIRFRRNQPVERQRGGHEFNRHEFETFLQTNGLVPFRWGAVELGMTEDSLRQTLDALEGDSMPVRLTPPISDQLVEENVVRDLHKWFPTLRGRIFSTHDSKCGALHNAIRAQYGIDVKPLHCVTSQVLDPTEPDYAAVFDAITLDPVGLRYQVWLDFKKPFNLRPDCCSLKLFAQERTLLEPYVMRGDMPEIPEALLRVPA
jgi:hypothetical protein